MNPNNDKNYIRVHKTTLLITGLILLAAASGWWVGHSDKPNVPTGNTTNNTQPLQQDNTSSSDVSSLVKYVLPDGWKQDACPDSKASFVAPVGTTADCAANPVSPVKLSVDASSSKDCNQLQNISDVKKHTCISLYINGRKSLKSSTEYLASSSYKQSTTVNAYYIDTGKGVVKVEYTYTSESQFQQGFDQLANSVTVKN